MLSRPTHAPGVDFTIAVLGLLLFVAQAALADNTTGAKPTLQFPNTAVVTPCHDEGVK